MFDANSKIGSGLMDGNIQDLGSYDQCVSVEAPSGLFQGQHCVVETRGLLPDYLMDPMNFEIEVGRPVERLGSILEYLFSVVLSNKEYN